MMYLLVVGSMFLVVSCQFLVVGYVSPYFAKSRLSLVQPDN